MYAWPRFSNGHLYNLRASAGYRKLAAVYQPTQATAVSIGERRRPEPEGRPGYIRVDTVHQGDWEGAKGVYHINAVDAVTQWQVVGCASRISEAYLQPVLEAILHQFPFRILGFHSDNGSEFVNREVARLLEKLRIEFTKSRANRSQDNALVEGKNGAVIRKLIGYGHIAGEHAEALQRFYTAHLNGYLNFHRPCGFATVSYDERGKRRRNYKARGLCHAVREAQESPRRGRLPQRECQLRMVGSTSEPHERYGVREEDGGRQSRPAEEGQERITDTAAVPLNPKARGCERRTGPGSRTDIAPLAEAVFGGGRREGNTGRRENRRVRCLPLVGVAGDSDEKDLKVLTTITIINQREQPDKTQTQTQTQTFPPLRRPHRRQGHLA